MPNFAILLRRSPLVLSVLLLAVALVSIACDNHKTVPVPQAISPAPLDLTFSPSTASPASALKDSELSHSVAAGTQVPVVLRCVVDSSRDAGAVVGVVGSNVAGTNGQIAIPAGSPVALIVRHQGKRARISEVDLGLYSINILGHQYSFTTGSKEAASLTFTEDSGLGAGHTSVHLYYGTTLPFKLDTAVQLR